MAAGSVSDIWWAHADWHGCSPVTQAFVLITIQMCILKKGAHILFSNKELSAINADSNLLMLINDENSALSWPHDWISAVMSIFFWK